MNTIVALLSNYFIYIASVSTAVILLAIIYFSKETIQNYNLIKKIKRVIDDNNLLKELISDNYTEKFLYKKSSVIEKTSHKHDIDFIKLASIDEIWIKMLYEKKRKKDFYRVLTYAPEKGLFICFLTCLTKKRFLPLLLKWLEDSGDLLYMRRIALSGKGEDFDGNLARKIFEYRLPQIREMTGDPEWSSRYFAVKVLIQDNNELSQRAIWEMMNDPHPLIRKTIAREFKTTDEDAFFPILNNLLIKDPSFEVRQTVWERITKNYARLFRPDFKSFSDIEKLHYLEFLQKGNEDDENKALHVLEVENQELR
jgi:hypothetical protein